MSPPPLGRLLDATSTEVLLQAARRLDDPALHSLAAVLPLADLPAAAPVWPPDAPGAAQVARMAERAEVWEPVDPDTYRGLVATPPGADPTAAGRRWVLVDPQIGAADRPTPPPDDAEQAWIDAGVAIERPVHVADGFDAGAWLDTLEPTPGLRWRLIDHAARLGVDALQTLAATPLAAQITVQRADHDGRALIVADALGRHATGPTLRTALLGLGPYSGLAPTERLVAPNVAAPPAWREAAEAAAHATGTRVPPHHFLWGAERHQEHDPDAAVDAQGSEATLRWNPRTLPTIVDQALTQWDLVLDQADRQRLVTLLRARLRPGERLDDATLYAFVATHVDLIHHATRSTAP